MTALRIETPTRLHFGLLGWGPNVPRQFGGVGLMLDEPRIVLTARIARDWCAEGPLAERALRIARAVGSPLDVDPIHFQVERAPGEHLGLGVGTQLSLAVAQAVLALAGETDLSLERLARLTGRGLRSGIGLHGFRHGGFIVDGGRGPSGALPSLLAHLAFPPEWSILLVTPRHSPGLHGIDEVNAFANLPSITQRMADHLCRIVLLGLMPAVVERDLDAFGAALTELQEQVGRCFAPAQGGSLASEESAAIVKFLREAGLHGVGQSSWGPTLYGFLNADRSTRDAITASITAAFPLGRECVRWTTASATGSIVTRLFRD